MSGCNVNINGRAYSEKDHQNAKILFESEFPGDFFTDFFDTYEDWLCLGKAFPELFYKHSGDVDKILVELQNIWFPQSTWTGLFVRDTVRGYVNIWTKHKSST